MQKFRTVVMGLGIRGKIHLNALLNNNDRYEIVGLCDINEQAMNDVVKSNNLTNVQLFTQAEEMLKLTKPDIFVFVTYPNMRLSLVKLAAKYGVKGISFEKPMAESLPEAKEMLTICNENNIKAVVCHQQKYTTQFQTLKKRINDGEIGEIRKIHVETQAWFSQLGTHYVDYALWASNAKSAKWVCGHCHGPVTLKDSHPAPDYLMGTFITDNDIRVYVECGYLTESHNPPMYASSDNRLTVYGTDGYVYAETDGFWGACTTKTQGKLITGKDKGWRNHQQIPIQTPYYKEYGNWMENDDEVHSCNIQIAYNGYEILEGMCISALENIRVDLPIANVNYEPVIDRMKNNLPDCNTEGRIVTVAIPPYERD